jgi:hypothetical protein
LFLTEVFEGVVGIERIDPHFKLLAIARGMRAAPSPSTLWRTPASSPTE